MKESGTYKNGLKVQKWFSYSKTGQISGESSYNGDYGYPEGPYTNYYDGKISGKGTLKYRPPGCEDCKGQTFSVGLIQEYYSNGQLRYEGRFEEDQESNTGVWKYYYDNGQIQSESIIKDGVEELKFYDKEGNLLPEGEGC